MNKRIRLLPALALGLSLASFLVLALPKFGLATSTLTPGPRGAWQKCSLPAGQGWILALAVSPAFDEDATVFAGTSHGGVWRSPDLGDHWQQVNQGLPSLLVMDLVISPAFAADRTLFLALDNQGVYKSSDGGGSWAAADSGLPSLDVRTIAISPNYTNDRKVFVGLQHEGKPHLYLSENGGESWSRYLTVTGGGEFMDISLPPAYAQDPTNIWALLKNALFKRKADNSGWVVQYQVGGLFDQRVLTRVLAASPTDIFLGVADSILGDARLVRSLNGGQSWLLGADLGGDETVWSLVASPQYQSDSTVFFGYDWNNRWGGSTNGVRVSSDRGASWSSMDAGLEDTTIRSLATAEDDNQTWLFAGTTEGLYRFVPLSAEISFGYVGAIQSVRASPLIKDKETAIEVEVIKQGRSELSGLSLRVKANGFSTNTFYLKEEATVETEWQLTTPHTTLDLPEGDCRRTLYFFAPNRQLVPQSAGTDIYPIEARISHPDLDPQVHTSWEDVLALQWGEQAQFRILCIPADWEMLGQEKGDKVAKTVANTQAFFQACFPLADEGEARLVVTEEKREESTKDKPWWWPLQWPPPTGLLERRHLWAWVVDQHSKWSKRAYPADRLLFLMPEGWFARRVGPPLQGAWGFDHQDRPNVPVAEARFNFPLYAGGELVVVPYTGHTPGWLAGHELGHSFGFGEATSLQSITSALDVVNKRVESESPGRYVMDLMWNNYVPDSQWTDDRWLLPEHYTQIAHQAAVAASASSAQAAGESKQILITAVLLADGQVEMLPWYILEGAEPDIDQMRSGEDFTLEYLNASGQIIYARGFADLFDLNGERQEIAPLSLVAPYSKGVGEIRLRRGPAPIFSRRVSAHPPTVAVTSPITGTTLAEGQVLIQWQTADPDGDQVVCSLTAYNESGDQIWPLADDLAESFYLWETTSLPLGSYRLEALVTDGINTAKTWVRVLKVKSTALPLLLTPPGPTPTPTPTPPVQNIGRVWGHVYDRQTGKVKQGVTICLGSTDGRHAWGGSSTSDEDGAYKFWWLPIDPNKGLDCAVWICQNGSCLSQIHLTLNNPERGSLDFWVDGSNYCR